jgi:hypothetical protein
MSARGEAALRRGGPLGGRGSLIRPPLRSPSWRAATIIALVACSVSSPQTEVKEALARGSPLELPAGPARVVVERARFSDVTVSVEGGRALVLALVEADGRVRSEGGEVALTYVGREAFAMERCPSRRWCAAGPALPALAGVVEALLAAPRPDGRRPARWQIRVERERALAGEDATLPGGGRAPRAVLDLVREGGRWSVARGT